LVGVTIGGFFSREFDRSELILAPPYSEEIYFPFYDVTLAPADAGEFVPAGTDRGGFGTLTLTFGYAFPGRGRKR